MATVPVTRTWVAGEVVTASYMNNNITAPIGWLLAPAICRVRQTVAQSLPNNTQTALTFDSEDVDSTGMHSTVSNTDRMAAVYPGWYRTGGGASIANAAISTARAALWDVNGTSLNGSTAQVPPSASGITGVAARSILVYLNVGDYLRLKAFQNSGGAVNTSGTTTEQSSADLTWESN